MGFDVAQLALAHGTVQSGSSLHVSHRRGRVLEALTSDDRLEAGCRDSGRRLTLCPSLCSRSQASACGRCAGLRLGHGLQYMWCHCYMLEVYSPWDFTQEHAYGASKPYLKPAHD